MQWEWLDKALEKGKNTPDVALTVLGAGLQMIVDRGLCPDYVERFKWKNRQKIYELIQKHEMDNIILLSGDIHS